MNKCLVFDKRLDVADLKPRSLLCVGGTRSGKSDFALHYAQNVQGPKTFIATMQKSFAAPQENSEQGNSAGQQKESTDKEIQKRILNHQKQRNSTWVTIEEPYDLISAANLAKRNNSKIILHKPLAFQFAARKRNGGSDFKKNKRRCENDKRYANSPCPCEQ